jgi:hypothetical protein
MKKVIGLLVLVFLLCLFVAEGNLAFGQEFGAIKGVVKDTEGAPLPGVTVTLTGSKILTMTDISSGRGNFRFLKMPVGSDYNLNFELPGFKTFTREALVVSFGRDVNLEIIMEMAEIHEEVTVVGQSPVIDTKRTQVGLNVNEKMIMSLPTARNPWVMMDGNLTTTDMDLPKMTTPGMSMGQISPILLPWGQPQLISTLPVMRKCRLTTVTMTSAHKLVESR